MHRSTALAFLSVLALSLAACGSGNDGPIDGEGECTAGLLAGDLVITEVMANPEGTDEGSEYFEIYNATASAINLTGLVLTKAAVDGSKSKTHVMRETVIEAGKYMALGGVLPEFRASYIGYGYSNDLGAMTNSGGQLSLTCKDIEVDLMVYGEAQSGRSQGLDGNLTPDHLLNDNLDNFCHATTEFAADSFGSPGVRNEPCSIVQQTTCLDEGTERDVVQPGVGDLVISEFMADPAVATDEVGEWIEVVATKSFDINGVVVGIEPGDPKVNIVDENCLKVVPGDRLLFTRSTDPLVNGGLPATDFSFSFGLTNSGSTLFVGVGDTVVDTIAWSSSRAGKSTSVDPAAENAIDNDDADNWCDGKVPYGDGDLGTPGAVNTLCDTSGMCMDGDTLRATVPPQAADVTITEFMPNPAAVLDSNGEYFEVHFAAAADLNGLQIGKVADPELIVSNSIDSVACVSVDAGAYVVFARKADPTVNGGLPTTNIFPTSVSLGQTSATTFTIFVAIGGELLDIVQYLGSDTSAGVSRQIDSDGITCNSTTEYGAGNDDKGIPPDKGTPGLANPLCLP